MAYLYRHIRLDKNEVFYVGIGSDENYDSKKCHLIFKRAYYKCARNKHWTSIIRKTPYEVEIIMEGLTWDEACDKEKEFIKFYGRRDLKEGTLCNLTDGGEGQFGYIHTEETKRKISLDNKRPEKLAVCLRNLEKAKSLEARRKARMNTDYSFMKNPEFIAQRTAKLDYKAIGEKIGKPILQFTKEGEFIQEWKSASVASKELKINQSHIRSTCRGLYKSAGGYVWKNKIHY